MTEALHIGGLPPSIRVVLLGGEAVPESLVRRCISLPGVESVYNLYGPTEDTVSSTGYRVLPDSVGPPPIGRPFGGSRAYILDAHRQAGSRRRDAESCILAASSSRAAISVAPSLPRRNSCPIPSGLPARACMQRAIYAGIGAMATLNTLAASTTKSSCVASASSWVRSIRCSVSIPSVRQCCTTVLGDGGDARLVSYLTITDAQRPSVGELRRHLAGHLPEYMVPARFIFLIRCRWIPTERSIGRALPAVEPADRSSEIAWSAPTTTLQKQLAAVWSNVLGVPRVGLEDDFFHLGGHSLRAVVAAGRIQQAMGIDVPVRMFFEHPTLACIGERARIKTSRPSGQKTVLPALPLLPREDRQLSHAQQRLWFQHRLSANAGLYNVTTAQKLIGPLDAAKLEQALGKVIARHEALRTSFPDTDGMPWAAIVPVKVARLKISIVDCSSQSIAARQTEVDRIITAEARNAFDLSRWPLMRVWLIRNTPNDHVLVLTMHHTICDDWSLRMLFEEIRRFYADGPALDPLPAQYGDFATWQDGWMATDGFLEELRYWESQLAGAPPLLEMPTDRPRPAVQTFSGTREPFTLDSELTHGLHALAKEEGATAFMSLLAVFSALLMQWTGQSDFVIGAAIAHRPHPEFQKLIGLFLNMQPLRMNIDGDPTFRQLMRRARKTALDAYANQNLPFEILIERLCRRRNPRYAPLFQILLVHLNESPPRLALPGIGSEAIPSLHAGAKFDMTLYFHEHEGRTEGAMEYNTDLFDRSTVRDLLDQLVLLMRNVVARPDSPLSRLPVTSQIAPHRSHAEPLVSEPRVVKLPAVHPITPTEQTLLDIWRELLGVSSFGVNDDFFELGGTSFLAVRIFAQIERRLSISLPLATLLVAPTIAQLARRLDLGGTPDSVTSNGIILLRRGNDGIPLFCVSGAGGQVFPFQKLAGLLHIDSAIYGLHFDGAGNVRMEEIAVTFIDRIRRIQPLGPYRLIGYSFGGALAYEMAQQLTGAGQIVEPLILIDAFVPGSIRPRPLMGRIGVHLGRLTSGGARGAFDHARQVAARCRDRLMPYRTRSGQNLPETQSTTEQLIKQIEGVNSTANRAYRPIPYNGNMVLFHATGRDPWREFLIDPYLNGWSSLVRGDLEAHGIPGTHQTLFDEPNVHFLAQQLIKYLDICRVAPIPLRC
jgi:thioesterase domain-containing protein/acyl carrier protein